MSTGVGLDPWVPRFVDTGGWYLFGLREHPAHEQAAGLIKETGRPPVTTTDVFGELLTLVRSRQDHHRAVGAGMLLRDPSVARLVRVTRDDEEAAWRLFQNRPDKAYSFTDCTSFVVMRRLGIEHVIATDDHFEQEGFTNLLHPAEA